MRFIALLALLFIPNGTIAKKWIGTLTNKEDGCGSTLDLSVSTVTSMTISDTLKVDDKTCFVFFDSDDKDMLSISTVFDEIEEDVIVKTGAGPKSWGLDRIDQGRLPLDNAPFEQAYTGKGVDVYITDTGIFTEHSDFNGRHIAVKDFVGEEGDPNGHGTHVSGTALGRTYGVAPEASLIMVKVFDKTGSGYISVIIKAVNWAVERAKGTKKKGVLSMSLGGSRNNAFNKVVSGASDAGLIVVVAAGNQNSDACNKSPASAGGNGDKGGVITVGSTTKYDSRSYFSNYGPCVDFFAPGSDIVSASNRYPTGGRILSGTSMATPHVAGVAALLLEKHDHDKSKAVEELFSILEENVIGGIPSATPNLFLQTPDSSNSCSIIRRRHRCRHVKECRWVRNEETRKSECVHEDDITPSPTPSPTCGCKN